MTVDSTLQYCCYVLDSLINTGTSQVSNAFLHTYLSAQCTEVNIIWVSLVKANHDRSLSGFDVSVKLLCNKSCWTLHFIRSTSIYHWNIEAIDFPILSICFFLLQVLRMIWSHLQLVLLLVRLSKSALVLSNVSSL